MIQTYLLAGVAGVAALGLTGYISYNNGYDNGANSVQVEFDDYKLNAIQAANKALSVIQKQQEALTEKTIIEYVDRVETITQTRTVNRDVIREVFSDSALISQGWVYAHDQLVEGLPIDPTLAADNSPSEYTYGEALEVVATNYGIANQGIAKDEAWNDFYSGVVASYNDYRLPAGGTASSTSDSPTAASPNRADDTTTETREN